MGDKTGISWCSKTWNPWRGCNMVSPGCAHCYMFRDQRKYGNDPEVIVRTKTWGEPYKWNRKLEGTGRRELVFTCSWSDFFIVDADPWRGEAWKVIKNTPNLTYQVLTKRIERVPSCLPPDWGDGYPNVCLMTSIENEKYAFRADHLRVIPARWRAISYEPALGPLDNLDLTGIHQVIFGGESGPNYRKCDLNWARSMLKKCRNAGVSFFYKQEGGLRPGTGEYLDGELIREFPEGMN